MNPVVNERNTGTLSEVNQGAIGSYGTNRGNRQEICEDLRKLGRSFFHLFGVLFSTV